MIKKVDFLKILFSYLILTSIEGWSQPGKLVYSEGLAPQKEFLKKENVWRYGFVDPGGKLRIKADYDTVMSGFTNGVAVVGKEGKAGLIDKKGEVVIPFRFADIKTSFGKKIVPVQNEQGLWGFYSRSGEEISPCLYNNFRFKEKGRIMAQKDGMWGLLGSDGNILLDFIHRELESLDEKGLYRTYGYNKWEVKDVHNKTLLTFNYDSLQPVGKGLYKYFMLGKYGLLNDKGNVITSYKYDSLGGEQYGLFVVKEWDKYGVIDRNGNVVLPTKYERVLIDSLQLRAAVKHTEKKLWWGIFTKDGTEIVSPQYPFVGIRSEDMLAVMAENGLWRYVDPFGNTVIPFKFSEAGAFEKGKALVKDPASGKRGIIDKKGDYIIEPQEYHLYERGIIMIASGNRKLYAIRTQDFEIVEQDQNCVKIRREGKYGLFTCDGRELVPVKYDKVSFPCADGYVVVETGKKKGVLNRYGGFSLPLTERFEVIEPYHNGFARVRIKGSYGYIDPRGNIYISVQYPATGEISDGMVAVKIKEKWGFVDTDEKLRVQPYYDEVWPFRNGVALVKQNNKFTLVDKNGKELYPMMDSITETPSGRFLLEANGRVGLAASNGKELLQLKYGVIQEASDKYLIVRQRGLFGAFDLDQNVVIPISYHKLYYDRWNNVFLAGTDNVAEERRVDK